jgi:hypothetical protein
MKNILTVIFVLLCNTALADSNNVMKQCLNEHGYDKDNFDTFDFTKAAKCHSEYRAVIQKEKLDELRDFLDANPRYRVPGQSLNRCWGKPREMPFESSYIRVGPDGMEAGVSYKDKLPAGCYENAPWDNRKSGK